MIISLAFVWLRYSFVSLFKLVLIWTIIRSHCTIATAHNANTHTKQARANNQYTKEPYIDILTWIFTKLKALYLYILVRNIILLHRKKSSSLRNKDIKNCQELIHQLRLLPTQYWSLSLWNYTIVWVCACARVFIGNLTTERLSFASAIIFTLHPSCLAFENILCPWLAHSLTYHLTRKAATATLT